MKKFDNLESEFEDLKKSLLSSNGNSDLTERIAALEESVNTLSSSQTYVHNIVLYNVTYYTECAFQIITKSPDEMAFLDVCEYLYSHGHISHSTGLPLTGGTYSGTDGTTYPYCVVYCITGTILYGKYYTGASTGTTVFGSGTGSWQIYDTVTKLAEE